MSLEKNESTVVNDGSFVIRIQSPELVRFEKEWYRTYSSDSDRDQPAFSIAYAEMYGEREPRMCSGRFHSTEVRQAACLVVKPGRDSGLLSKKKKSPAAFLSPTLPSFMHCVVPLSALVETIVIPNNEARFADEYSFLLLMDEETSHTVPKNVNIRRFLLQTALQRCS